MIGIDLAATHKELVEIERQIQESTAKHNEFLKELGLDPLPGRSVIKGISPTRMINRNRTSKPTGTSGLREGLVYARVSSKKREKEGLSIPTQINLLCDLFKCGSVMFFRPVGQMATEKRSVEDELSR